MMLEHFKHAFNFFKNLIKSKFIWCVVHCLQFSQHWNKYTYTNTHSLTYKKTHIGETIIQNGLDCPKAENLMKTFRNLDLFR